MMTQEEELYQAIDTCVSYNDQKQFKVHVVEVLSIYEKNEACLFFCKYFIRNYMSYRSGYLAIFVELLIKEWPEFATLQFPRNPLFIFIMAKGSIDIYECFMEEAIEPLLQELTNDDAYDYVGDLVVEAEKINEDCFEKYTYQLKGKQYNGAVRSNEQAHLMTIYAEDFAYMEDLIEAYNEMIGRRDILKDLYRRLDRIN